MTINLSRGHRLISKWFEILAISIFTTNLRWLWIFLTNYQILKLQFQLVRPVTVSYTESTGFKSLPFQHLDLEEKLFS